MRRGGSAWLVISPLGAAPSDGMWIGDLAVAGYVWWALPLTPGRGWGAPEHNGPSAEAWHGPSVPDQPFFHKCKSTCDVSLCAVEVIPLFFIKVCQARHGLVGAPLWRDTQRGAGLPVGGELLSRESCCPRSG